MIRGGTKLTRRALMQLCARAIALLSACNVVPRFARATELPAEPDLKLLSEILYLLYPHPKLDRTVYGDVARAIWQRARSSPESEAMLREGLNSLTFFPAVIPAKRVAMLHEREGEPFLAHVLSAGAELLYRDPRVWKLIGYGGNALAQGGYLNRGFNDISWLPGRNRS